MIAAVVIPDERDLSAPAPAPPGPPGPPGPPEVAQERRARLWLTAPDAAPLPLPSVPFDASKFDRPANQTERLLREARGDAARKAARAVGYGGAARGPETDLQAAWESQRAECDGRGPAHWHQPAHVLGMTQQRVAEAYGVHPRCVHQAFRRGSVDEGTSGQAFAPIGRRDGWDVWFTVPEDANRLFGREARAGRTARSDVQTAAAARYERLVAKMRAEGRIS